MRIETTFCDTCDADNVGCLAHTSGGDTCLAVCSECVTDGELDSFTEQRLSFLWHNNRHCGMVTEFEEVFDAPEAGPPLADRQSSFCALFLGAWF